MMISRSSPFSWLYHLSDCPHQIDSILASLMSSPDSLLLLLHTHLQHYNLKVFPKLCPCNLSHPGCEDHPCNCPVTSKPCPLFGNIPVQFSPSLLQPLPVPGLPPQYRRPVLCQLLHILLSLCRPFPDQLPLLS